ncbi:MAG: hypothetical protein ACRDL8_12045, partial [Solirubrobacteraceae bacterium]
MIKIRDRPVQLTLERTDAETRRRHCLPDGDHGGLGSATALCVCGDETSRICLDAVEAIGCPAELRQESVNREVAVERRP